MPTSRTTYKYHLKRGNKILHAGITNDPFRRLDEHRKEFGDDVRLKRVGYRTTREEATKWEDEQRQQGKPTAPKH